MNTDKHQITVANINVDVVRKDIKNLHLGVYPPDGRVRVAAPLRISDEAVRLLVISKLAWIKKRQSSFRRQERESEREYVSGESHYYQGRRYLLNVIYQKGKSRVQIRNKTYIDMYVNLGTDQAGRQKVLNKWYRTCLKEQVSALLTKWEGIIGVEATDWRIRKMRTKWGSCSRDTGRIWLNLELAKKPSHCLEFIIVHELTHLLERNHNGHFEALMDCFMPQWRAYKQELNQVIQPYDGRGQC